MENETRTVRNYRHAARRSLTGAREALALRSNETREVYHLLNGAIEGVIRGEVGLSQESQVERLNKAHTTLQENLADLPAKVEAAKASVTALLEEWENSIKSKAEEALATLAEAATFAEERDFEAWQAQKAERKSSYAYSYSEGEDDEETYDGEDDDDE